MSGWTLRREERDGQIVKVLVYDSGRDEDGFRDCDESDEDENEINDEWMGGVQ